MYNNSMLIKEELLKYFVDGHIHISNKDYTFFLNLQKFVGQNKITTNQTKLFDKLIIKYQRQLKKEKLDVDFLVNLKWKTTIIASDINYIIPKLFIQGDKLNIRTPFNRKFQHLMSGCRDIFVWDKEVKFYKGTLTTRSLKLAVQALNECFETFNTCNKVQNLLTEISNYNNCIWEPTLIKVKSKLYVAALNESLERAICHIELSDDIKTYYTLSLYGIKVDSSVVNDQHLLKFFNNHTSDFCSADFDILLNIFDKCKVDKVLIAQFMHSRPVSLAFRQKLEKNNMKHEIVERSNQNRINGEGAVLVKFAKSIWSDNIKNVEKVIHIGDIEPITIL